MICPFACCSFCFSFGFFFFLLPSCLSAFGVLCGFSDPHVRRQFSSLDSFWSILELRCLCCSKCLRLRPGRSFECSSAPSWSSLARCCFSRSSCSILRRVRTLECCLPPCCWSLPLLLSLVMYLSPWFSCFFVVLPLELSASPLSPIRPAHSFLFAYPTFQEYPFALVQTSRRASFQPRLRVVLHDRAMISSAVKTSSFEFRLVFETFLGLFELRSYCLSNLAFTSFSAREIPWSSGDEFSCRWWFLSIQNSRDFLTSQRLTFALQLLPECSRFCSGMFHCVQFSCILLQSFDSQPRMAMFHPISD
jgi:hypothetical protein